MFSSVGLTNTSCVDHPPPSAKCGKYAISPAAAVSGLTGKVVSRNSDRSFVSPRKATTATGTSELNVNVPLTDDPPLNGLSLRNLAICPFGGTVAVPAPKFDPL